MTYSHGVFPLVYNTLKIYSDLIPDVKLIYMKKIYMDIVKQNMLMTSELLTVLKLLKENSIKSIPFKGPILSNVAYGNVISRQYVDLDILILDNKELLNVYKLLTNNGFTTEVDIALMTNEIYIKKGSDIQFYNIKNNILIEIHWQLFRNELSKYNFDKLIYTNIIIEKLNYQEIEILSNEFKLVYLCSHGTKHIWERIEWIIDIDKLIKNTQINWKLVENIAKETNSSKMLKLGLLLTNKLFQTEIPNNMISKIEEKKYNINANIIYNRLLHINKENTEFNNNWDNFKFNYIFQESILLKLKFVYMTLFYIKDRDLDEDTSTLLVIYKRRFLRLMKKYF